MKYMKYGIVGYGEIGSSLGELYAEIGKVVGVLDSKLNIKTLNANVEVMNICFPFSEDFVESVIDYSMEYKPKVIIIHTTVPVGTTKKIEAELEKCYIVHSPVRGVHPNLLEGIKTFVKYIGYNQRIGLILAEEHFQKLGIKTRAIQNTDSTELAKLLSTTYYGLLIAWHGEMKEMCDKYGVPFSTIKDWTHTYNEGYLSLGMMNVIRPNLVPPEKHIGGHCIIPNTRLLKQTEGSIALDLILEYEYKEK